MDFKKCNKCSNDLPFYASTDEISCLFCGEKHVFKNVTVKDKLPKRSNKSSNSDIGSVSAVSIILGSDN